VDNEEHNRREARPHPPAGTSRQFEVPLPTGNQQDLGAKYYLSTSSTKAGIQRYLKEGIEGLKDKPRTKEREATEVPSRYHHSDKEGASRE